MGCKTALKLILFQLKLAVAQSAAIAGKPRSYKTQQQ
jgi:hypothetical protein